MEKNLKKIPDFNDLVFELRNKEYGAYVLRKMYKRNLIISMLIAIIIVAAAILTPFFNARALQSSRTHAERLVEIRMEKLDQPNEIVAPPPPPPPPPADIVKQQKYIPPVVVDSIRPEDNVELMTADEARIEVTNSEVVDAVQEVKEEVQEAEVEPPPFVVVEEMPEPQGGSSGLYKFISEHLKYPPVAEENNIQGRVFVKFCVTSKGTIDMVSVTKGVDPELDAEATRVVKTLPAFKPGRQGGRPVPVWYTVAINFQLMQR